MPNTLAHLGVQTLCSKALWRAADSKWIAVGCVIPDLPWIGQRLLNGVFPALDPIGVRLYSMVQASLFFSLLLALALALLAMSWRRVFLLLAANSLFHLLLDASEYKWANGVHLLAPVSWALTSFGLFWPEDWPVLALTALGIPVLCFFGWRERRVPVELTTRRIPAAALLLAVYLLLPLFLLQGPLTADNHYTATLRDREHRSGRPIAVDRRSFHLADSSMVLFTGEKIRLTGDLPTGDGVLSLQGVFLDPATVAVQEYHRHDGRRDRYTTLGLGAVLLLWALAFSKKRIKMVS